MVPGNELERDIAAWLEENVARSDTIRQNPENTIVPPLATADTGGRRALDLLSELAGGSVSAQLELGATIGEGGMGIVRIAEQVALGRKVAVKTLRSERKSSAAVVDLLREAWVTGSLEHPNIVPIYHVGLDESGSPIIVLKRIEGVEWSSLIHDADGIRARFGATDLLEWNIEILLQVLNAVRFAHSRGVVHRDLKPDNVMIGEFGEVYLLDWGIAVSVRDDGSGRMPLARDATQMAGTPCYMAPEMLGEAEITTRTDIYLAGAVLYEMLAGHAPHQGDSALSIITSVAASQPELPGDVPAVLAGICRRAMARAPNARHDTADELRAALQRYLHHRDSDRLAAQAQARLSELLEFLQSPLDDAATQRQRVYKLFGECRFGFQEALARWPESPDANEGLRWAIRAMIEEELRQGSPRTAATLLAELERPPAELGARVERALEAAEQERRHAAALAREHDASVGQRTRWFVSIVLGVAFTTLPLLGALRQSWVDAQSVKSLIGFSTGFIVILLGIGAWSRDSMMKTAINRNIFASMLVVFAAQILLAGGANLLDLPVVSIQVLMPFLWTVIASMMAIVVDRRLALCAAGFGAAFLFSAAYPALRMWAMSASNLILTINLFVLWRPGAGYIDSRER